MSGDNGTLVEPNLPDENYVSGSYCIVDTRAVPGWKTVVGYAVVALFVLVFVWTGKILAKTWPVVEASDFPMLDYDVLIMLVDEKPNTVLLRERFIGRPYKGGNVLDAVADLRIGLKDV
ncbi:hypothetical protein K505DRAFT_360049 [Melanomma pulvis-pyrius CBS 109.77]|uniref:Uncharacterized protein n=1 Tax=Melanomma pulvis-pyrius CBS 109.77 TaxID=1314802 RepID=A0A6A6XG89_9PLEO|nr:hypothetical protein K505DRAFT_360049 [Melanomma pulvis-pyrius CBS 109.77]